MASSQTNTADVLRRLGLDVKAREGYEEAVSCRERLVQQNPAVMAYRSDLAISLRRRGLLRLDQGDSAGAATDIRRALKIRNELSSPSGEDWFETACCLASLATLAGRDGSGVSTSEIAAEADSTIAILKKAISLGFRCYGRYRQESALTMLRGRADFRQVMMDLAIPADVFAAVNAHLLAECEYRGYGSFWRSWARRRARFEPHPAPVPGESLGGLRAPTAAQ